jgi:hypothetical protein
MFLDKGFPISLDTYLARTGAIVMIMFAGVVGLRLLLLSGALACSVVVVLSAIWLARLLGLR